MINPEPAYQKAHAVAFALAKAGWAIGTFGKTLKWYNQEKDDGARYCVDNPRSIRYIMEDYPEQFKND